MGEERERYAGERLRAFARRFVTDGDFRARTTLRASFAVSIFFAVYQGILGLWRGSAWFGTLSFEYIVLVVLRWLLVRQAQAEEPEPAANWRTYRLCGWLLLGLSLAIAGLTLLSTVSGEHKSFGAITIFAVAFWCFYSLTLALVNVWRYRGATDPIITASKVVSLAGALISIFGLQGALIARYGADAHDFAVRMNLMLGIGVFIALNLMAVLMVRRASTALVELAAGTETPAEGGPA